MPKVLHELVQRAWGAECAARPVLSEWKQVLEDLLPDKHKNLDEGTYQTSQTEVQQPEPHESGRGFDSPLLVPPLPPSPSAWTQPIVLCLTCTAGVGVYFGYNIIGATAVQLGKDFIVDTGQSSAAR
jgi:hypothetical protein